jgi:putative hemolysin
VNDLFRILVILLLVVGNGVFVAAEYALVTARRSRLEALAASGNRRAATAVRLMDNPVGFISTVQVGITALSILIGAIGQPLLEEVFDPWMASILAFVFAFLILTYLSLVIGELVPKALALQKAERLAMTLAIPVSGLQRVTAPLVWVLERSSNGLLRLFGIHPLRGGHPPHRRRGRGHRRHRDGGGGDALQGLRLRRQGGARGDGAAPRGRGPLGRHPT